MNDSKRYFIGFDSDGCVFDTMEIKHKECFAPVTIHKWNLQPVSRFARQCHEFVNLYSKWRGINRFPALLKTLELLATRPDCVRRGFRGENIAPLKEWLEREKRPSNERLRAALVQNDHAILRKTLEWSDMINARIKEMVYAVPPFPGVREFLERAQPECTMVVVSQTPREALDREWKEHVLAGFVQGIYGQEHGTKADHLQFSIKGTPPEHSLMVGDAYGDYDAAQSVNAMFFPILPGREEESWRRLTDEGYSRFKAGTFAGDYQQSLLAEMDHILPENPPWL